jgi:hypothetical protein
MESKCNCSVNWGLLGKEYGARVQIQKLRGLVADQQSSTARQQSEIATAAVQHQKRVARQQSLIQQHRAQIQRQRAQLAEKNVQSARQQAEICALTKRFAAPAFRSNERNPRRSLETARVAHLRRTVLEQPTNQVLRMGRVLAELQIRSTAREPREAPRKGLLGWLGDILKSMWSLLVRLSNR